MSERFYEKCDSNSRTLNISLAEYLWKRLGEYLQLFGLLLQISHFARTLFESMGYSVKDISPFGMP